jgi:hypothetical protein
MRIFNKLFVIALPRCATVSMSQALGMLGIPTAHLGKIYHFDNTRQHNAEKLGESHHDTEQLGKMLQQIEAGDFELEILSQCRGLADYPACCFEVMQHLDRQYPGSLFVNVKRSSIDRWLQSVEAQFMGLELLNIAKASTLNNSSFIEVMQRFRKMTFGHIRFDALRFAEAYVRFQTQVTKYFCNRSDLLEFPDVSQLSSEGFARLAQFLEIRPVPEMPFPCSNNHSRAPEQAFLAALRTGKIHSQTGLK